MNVIERPNPVLPHFFTGAAGDVHPQVHAKMREVLLSEDRCARYNRQDHPRIGAKEEKLNEQVLGLFDRIRLNDETPTTGNGLFELPAR